MVPGASCLRSSHHLLFAGDDGQRLYFADADSTRWFGLEPFATLPDLPRIFSRRSTVIVEDTRVYGFDVLPHHPAHAWAQSRDGTPIWDGPVDNVIHPLGGGPWLAALDRKLLRIADGTIVGRLPRTSGDLFSLPAGVLERAKRLTLHGTRAVAKVECDDLGWAFDQLIAISGDSCIALDPRTLEQRGRERFGGPVTEIAGVTGGALVRTHQGRLLFVEGSLSGKRTELASSLHTGTVITAGDRWFVGGGDVALAGRGPSASVVRFDFDVREVARARAGVIVCERASSEAAVPGRGERILYLPWESFDRPGSVNAQSIEVAFRAPLQFPAKLLLAGPTMFRVEITGDLDPRWRRTATLPSHGNPLGLRVGDPVIVDAHVEPHWSEPSLVIERVVGGGVPGDSCTLGEPVTVATVGITRPSWIDVVVRFGLVGREEDLPQEVWHLEPLSALSSIYTSRGAISRGFLYYDHKFWNDTEDPVADLAALAAAPWLDIEMIDKTYDHVTIQHAIAGGRPTTTRVDLEDGLYALVDHLNAILASMPGARRIYHWTTNGDWYTFLARTPDEIRALQAAAIEGLTLLTD